MKVLFCSSELPVLNVHNTYQGGGWILSLVKEIRKIDDLIVGYSYLDSKSEETKLIDGISLFPIKPLEHSYINQLKLFLGGDYKVAERRIWGYYFSEFRKILSVFKPDVIYVFGTENYFGLISQIAVVPVVLHLQGLLSPCLNAYMPPGFSWYHHVFSPYSFYREKMTRIEFERSCYREKTIIKSCKYFFGRTEWDNHFIEILNPNCCYVKNWEILRDPFYMVEQRCIPQALSIVSIISSPLYKGYDLILKTAKIIKCARSVQFEWKVFGNVQPATVENHIGIKHEDVNVNLLGVATPETLKKEILNSTVYVHPSYIDNSPNSVCEAQILGSTVIATNVGGVSSLIEEGKTGFLVPANDPYEMAYVILSLYNNRELNETIGKKSKILACKRHDKDVIINMICKILREMSES